MREPFVEFDMGGFLAGEAETGVGLDVLETGIGWVAGQ